MAKELNKFNFIYFYETKMKGNAERFSDLSMSPRYLMTASVTFLHLCSVFLLLCLLQKCSNELLDFLTELHSSSSIYSFHTLVWCFWYAMETNTLQYDIGMIITWEIFKTFFPFLYPLLASFCPSSPSLSLRPSSLLPLSLHPSFFPLYLSFLFWERTLPGLECFTFLSAGIIGMPCHCNILKLSGQGEFNSTAVSFSGVCYHFNKPFHSPCCCGVICTKINICSYNKSLYRN